MDEVLDAVGPSRDDGALPAVVEVSARRHRRSEELFSTGQARGAYKRSWGSTSSDASGDTGDRGDGATGDRDGVERRPDSAMSDEGDGDSSSGPAPKRRVCACRTVLAVHVESFRGMKRQGADLKRRKRYTPTGARLSPEECFRDVNAQNDWLLSNIFDASGNYLYCRNCVESILGVSKQRLARLRKLKAEKKQGKHGLTGKKSNRAVTEVKKRFLDFVDHSRSPNGRRLGSSSARYYFDAVFTSLRAPDKVDANCEAKMKRSVVGSFNLAEKASGFPGCSNWAAQQWMEQERPDTAICPLKLVYCDLCKEYREQVNRLQATLYRLRESGHPNEDELRANQRLAESYRKLLNEHKERAQACLDCCKKQRNESQDSWKKIAEIEKRGCFDVAEE